MGGSLKQNTFIIEHKRWTLHVAWNLTFWNENATKDLVCYSKHAKRHKILILCNDLMEHNNNINDFVGTFVGK